MTRVVEIPLEDLGLVVQNIAEELYQARTKAQRREAFRAIRALLRSSKLFILAGEEPHSISIGCDKNGEPMLFVHIQE